MTLKLALREQTNIFWTQPEPSRGTSGEIKHNILFCISNLCFRVHQRDKGVCSYWIVICILTIVIIIITAIPRSWWGPTVPPSSFTGLWTLYLWEYETLKITIIQNVDFLKYIFDQDISHCFYFNILRDVFRKHFCDNFSAFVRKVRFFILSYIYWFFLHCRWTRWSLFYKRHWRDNWSQFGKLWSTSNFWPYFWGQSQGNWFDL